MTAPDRTVELAESFRDVMAGVATPVSVVTTLVDGEPHGTTVSAFASLSMDPPMVLVSLDRQSNLLALLTEGGLFGVNVLATGQAAVANRFARRGPDDFADLEWESAAGAPRLAGAAGWLACRVTQLVEGGDHVVVLGNVAAAAATDAAPLTYHLRRFGTHTPHD